MGFDGKAGDDALVGGVCDVCLELRESTAHYLTAPWYRCDHCAEVLRMRARSRARQLQYARALSQVYLRRVRGQS
jgi:hypothetical protein